MQIGTKLKNCTDKHGRPVHIGDQLSFDPICRDDVLFSHVEWRSENVFILEWDDEEYRLNIGFPLSYIKKWCEVVRKWDEKDPLAEDQ